MPVNIINYKDNRKPYFNNLHFYRLIMYSVLITCKFDNGVLIDFSKL